MLILTLALVVLTANAAEPLPVAIPPSNEPVAVALDLVGPMPSRWEASGKGWAGRGEEGEFSHWERAWRSIVTPATPEALQRELPDDRFISDVFPPIRLIFPDGTKEPEPKGRYEIARVLKVQPLTGEHVLKAFAKDVPFDPDAKSAAAVDDTPLVDPQLLFDQRRVKEWSK